MCPQGPLVAEMSATFADLSVTGAATGQGTKKVIKIEPHQGRDQIHSFSPGMLATFSVMEESIFRPADDAICDG